MPKLVMMRERVVQELMRDIPNNLDRYRNGNFDYLLSNHSNFIETAFEVDISELSKVTCTVEDHNEVQCCLAMYRAMSSTSPYLARDERLWVPFTHILLLGYCRNRWPIPKNDEKAIRHIRKHFFAVGSRGVERENAASRLWWMASICSKVEGMDLEAALTAFLYQTDVRANVIERPTTSQNVTLLTAIVRNLDISLRKDRELHKRERFRSVMKDLNLQGGFKLLDVLDKDDLTKLVDKYATKE